MKALKVYLGNYYTKYQDMSLAVVANTESEALGMVLSEYLDTKAKHWSFEELDSTEAGVYFISSAER